MIDIKLQCFFVKSVAKFLMNDEYEKITFISKLKNFFYVDGSKFQFNLSLSLSLSLSEYIYNL